MPKPTITTTDMAAAAGVVSQMQCGCGCYTWKVGLAVNGDGTRQIAVIECAFCEKQVPVPQHGGMGPRRQ